MKPSQIIIGILFLTGCAAGKFVPPTQSDADRVQARFPGYTLADLNRGKTLFEQKCSVCHGLKKPSSRSEMQWNEIVPEMTRIANKKEKFIDESAEQDILRYLITMSTAPKRK